MKHLLAIPLVTLLLAACCSPQKESAPVTVYGQIENLYSLADDTSSTFKDYEPLFLSILDSLEDIVLHHPNADERFLARQMPHIILEFIDHAEPDNRGDSIWNVYNQRREDILYTWYVQQLIDSIDNSPYVIMSYAAPFDEDRNVTHIGFTFSENNNPNVEPVMIITLPDITDEVIILFSLWDENNITRYTEYYSNRGDMTIASDSTGTSILLFGKFLQDMLKYEEMKICYPNEHVNTEECRFEPLIQGMSRIPIDLHQFQKQYYSVHQWLKSLTNK